MKSLNPVTKRLSRTLFAASSLCLILFFIPILKDNLDLQTSAAEPERIITSITPDFGPSEGGQIVTVFGEDLDPGITWDAVSPGQIHTCALDTTGKAYCWGYNGDGELGDGTDIDRTLPAPISSSLRFTQITSGDYHTCALDTTGLAYCWGSNNDGQLGSGDTISKSLPTPVSLGLTFQEIDATGSNTCALTFDAKVYCWGNDYSGELGDGGTNTDKSIPTQINLAVPAFIKVAVGYDHSCALDTAGQAYCWGNNSNGQLGNGYSGYGFNQSSPVISGVGFSFSSISAGSKLTCGLDNLGKAYCWGNGSFSQMGNGLDITANALPVATAATMTFKQISAGGYHACGIDQNDKAYCWGYNAYGQMADGTSDTSLLITSIDPSLSFSQIKGGTYFNCAIDLMGKMYCWGDNSDGQLGLGNSGGAVLVPTPLAKIGLSAYSVNFGNLSVPAFNITNTSVQAITPPHPAGLIDISLTNLDTDLDTNILVDAYTYIGSSEPLSPVATMIPTSTESGSPSLSGPTNVNPTYHDIAIIIDGKSYPATNNGDGTWSLAAGTIIPSLNPGAYDVTIQITTVGGEFVSRDSVIGGLTILDKGSLNSIDLPATGYGKANFLMLSIPAIILIFGCIGLGLRLRLQIR